MRIAKLWVFIAPLFAVLLAGTACQTAQRPVTLLPPAQAQAPALTNPPEPAPKPVATAPAAPPAVQPSPKPDAKPDPVADLIAEVEKQYQAGEESTKAGNLEDAKQSFERAYNLLMGSSLDIHSDDRLLNEYDKVMAGINDRELQALQQQNSETPASQSSPPAPIDEVNELTPSVDAGVKAKAEAEVKSTHSDLPLMLTDPVAGYINYFSGRGHGVLERALTRGGRYQEMIRTILKQEGVPQELIYLAQAESGFHPLAVSRVGARGMWQFMASRARGYGLQHTPWVDERQDPEKSTRAAAHHLKDLYAQFGDWYLAMAAYNSGPGTVQSAVKRTGYADFWELYQRNVLPRETRNYVPIIVAVTIMAKNPAQYGLDTVVPEPPVPYDTVKIDYPVDLRLVAQCVGSTAAILQDLNPSLLRYSTPKDQRFELHLPAGTKDEYTQAIAAIPQDMRVWWRYHKVAPGDTLASVARTYRTTPQAIARANSLAGGESLEADGKLIIPLAPGKHAAGEDSGTYARHLTVYKVHRGDTVQTVAENYGVPATMVRRWNHLKGDSLLGRRIVYVHLPVTPTASQSRHTVVATKSKPHKTLQASNPPAALRHTVKRGETLYSIATSYKTTVAALKRENGNLAILRPGMILVIREVR